MKEAPDEKPSRDLRDELADIFAKACRVMKKKLAKPSEVTAADLNAILGFLKYNGITAVPVPGKDLDELADAAEKFVLPFPAGGKILAEDDPAVKARVAKAADS